MMSSRWELGLGRRTTHALLLVASLYASACSSATNDPTELSVVVNGDSAIMSQLSRVDVQTFNRDGSELLEYHSFALADAAGAPLAPGLPLTHSFRPPRDKGDTVRVLAVGIGLVDGAPRTLVEAQKTASFLSGRTRELELYFAAACFQKFCRGELRGSTLTCAEGRCVSIPSADETTENLRDASEPVMRPALDADGPGDARVEDEAAVSTDTDSGSAPPDSGNELGCDGGAKPSCLCANGAPPPCEAAPIDAGPACDVGKHMGMFTGDVGQNSSAPNTPISGTLSFEVPAPGASSVVTIVQGSIKGATANGSTMVARVEGRWNCALRALEAGRVVDGVYTYAERVLNDTVAFSGTLTGSYAAGAQSVTGDWKTSAENGTGGFGTWSARR